MRRGEVAIALGTASGVGWIATTRGVSIYASAAAAIIAFFGTWWLVSWIRRSIHYHRHGNYSDRAYCPTCREERHRLSGDWILTCRTCGWNAGWPGIRWLTRSVPVNQLWNTISLPSAAVVALASIIVVSSLGLGVGVSTPTNGPALQTTDSGDAPQETGVAFGYDRADVEARFLDLLNDERESRGLTPVEQRDVLSEMGRAHAQNMAKHDYLGHVQPDGTTIADRYESRGLLPECRLDKAGTNKYYPGAENVYQGWIDTRVELSTGNTLRVNDARSLAQVMFNSWMNSPGHREAMLVASADEAGLGIAKVSGSDKIYAALELC